MSKAKGDWRKGMSLQSLAELTHASFRALWPSTLLSDFAHRRGVLVEITLSLSKVRRMFGTLIYHRLRSARFAGRLPRHAQLFRDTLRGQSNRPSRLTVGPGRGLAGGTGPAPAAPRTSLGS